MLYRVYVTSVLKVQAEQFGANVSTSYYELIKSDEQEEEELNGDEVALQVIQRAGLKGKA